MTPATEFADAYRTRDVTPERLALEIARIAYPTLDMARELAQLDVLAEYVQREMAGDERPQGQESNAERFLRVITQQLDFHGDQETYHDPRNSLLPDVVRILQLRHFAHLAAQEIQRLR